MPLFKENGLDGVSLGKVRQGEASESGQLDLPIGGLLEK